MNINQHVFIIYLYYFLALTISINSGFKDAPPTKNPSMSFSLASSLQLAAVTDPPYIIRVVLATFSLTSSVNHFRKIWWTS